MQWRLTLDPQMSLSIEPGYIRTVHSADFAEESDGFSGTWRDPVTNLVMLLPNWLKRDYSTGLKPLTSFRYQTGGGTTMWARSKKSRDLAEMCSVVQPAGWVVADIDLGLDIGQAQEAPDDAEDDKLYWGLESLGWELEADEGFVLYYYGLEDEVARKNNWLAVCWDRWYIRVNMGGKALVYEWADPSDITAAPTLVHEFKVAYPQETMSQMGFMAFTPIPSRGIACHWSSSISQQQTPNARNYSSSVVRGHLIPLQSTWDSGAAQWSLTTRSPLRVAVNPHMPTVLGVQTIAYSTDGGTYTDAIFDPGYPLTTSPVACTAQCIQTPYQDVTGSVLAPGLAAWSPATDRQARIMLTLDTDDTRHTPFVRGYHVEWSPVYATRATTPVVVSKVRKLEMTQGTDYDIEGTAELVLETEAEQLIADRGDCTYLVEYSIDGSTWTSAFGGFARFTSNEVVTYGDTLWYESRVELKSLRPRFQETHVNLHTAFDWMTLGDGINLAIRGAGMPEVASVPAALQAIVVPGSDDGQAWRYAPQEGDDGWKAIQALLALSRTQQSEYILYYSWTGGGWVLAQRTLDTSTPVYFTLTPSEDDPANGVYKIASMTMRPTPPEGNIVTVAGVTRLDSYARRVVSTPLVNQDSLDDTSSMDYLGRGVIMLGKLTELGSQDWVDHAARMVYDAAAHWKLDATVTRADFMPSLAPNVYVIVRKSLGDDWYAMVIKRRTVTVEPGGVSLIVGEAPTSGYTETVSYELSTMWESEADDA